MKKRDIIIIIVSVVVVIITGALLYRYLAPPTKDSAIKVKVPRPVDPNFNQDQLNTLKNDVVDFSQNINPADTSPQQNSNQSGQNNSNQSAKPEGLQSAGGSSVNSQRR